MDYEEGIMDQEKSVYALAGEKPHRAMEQWFKKFANRSPFISYSYSRKGTSNVAAAKKEWSKGKKFVNRRIRNMMFHNQ